MALKINVFFTLCAVTFVWTTGAQAQDVDDGAGDVFQAQLEREYGYIPARRTIPAREHAQAGDRVAIAGYSWGEREVWLGNCRNTFNQGFAEPQIAVAEYCDAYLARYEYEAGIEAPSRPVGEYPNPAPENQPIN